MELKSIASMSGKLLLKHRFKECMLMKHCIYDNDIHTCSNCLNKKNGSKENENVGPVHKIGNVATKEQKKRFSPGYTSYKKYRVHQVAKDFDLDIKEIIKVLSEYDIPVKNHMQVLKKEELDIIFEYFTQHSSEPFTFQGRKNNPVQDVVFKSRYPVSIIIWDENDYYVAGINGKSLTREVIVEACSNHAKYFESYDEALEYAKKLSDNCQVINMCNYAIPDLGLI